MNSSNEIFEKTNSLLQEIMLVEKKANMNDLTALTPLLIQASDYFDRINKSEASFFIDEALLKLSQDGVKVELQSILNVPGFISKNPIATLIRIADKLDELNKQSISNNIDMALAIL